MTDVIKVSSESPAGDLNDLEVLIRDRAPELLARRGTLRSNGYATEIILALGTAGAFKTLLEIVKAYFEREKARKITISSSRGTLTIDAHDIAKIDEAFVRDATKKLLAP